MEAEQWGRKIRAFRKLKGHTQQTLAEQLHISVSVLGEVERGNRMPSEDFLREIALLLNISRQELGPEGEQNDA